MNKRDFERDAKIYQRRLDGYTYREIGTEFGITPGRCREIYLRQIRWLKRQEAIKGDVTGALELTGLDIRIVRCLQMYGLTTIQEVETVTEQQLLETPNFGMRSLKILKRYMDEKGLKFRASESPSLGRLIGQYVEVDKKYQLAQIRMKKIKVEVLSLRAKRAMLGRQIDAFETEES